jgi:hypothetical protein
MRLVGDYWYYVFWSGVGLTAMYLLWRIERHLAELVTIWTLK